MVEFCLHPGYQPSIKFLVQLMVCFGLVGLAITAVSGHGLLDEQIEDATRRLAEKPGDQGIILERAELYWLHGDYGKARVDLGVLMGTKEPPARVFYVLALVNRDEGDLKKALEAMSDYLAANKDDGPAYREAAGLSAKLGDDARAVSFWEKFLATMKAETVSATDYGEAGNSMLKVGRVLEAEILAESGKKQYPHSIVLCQLRARCFLQQNDVQSAKAEFQNLRDRYENLIPRLSLQEGLIFREFKKVHESRLAWQRGVVAIEELRGKGRLKAGMLELEQELQKELR